MQPCLSLAVYNHVSLHRTRHIILAIFRALLLCYCQKLFVNLSNLRIVYGNKSLCTKASAYIYLTVAPSSQHKSVKEEEPPAHLVDDVDFVEAHSVNVAHGPFAAHVDKSGIIVNQVFARVFLFLVVVHLRISSS